jgi:hypothetical protein
MSSCGTVGEAGAADGSGRPNLVRTNTRSDPRLEELRQAAAADVALLESDNQRPGQADPDEQVDEAGPDER